MNSIQYHININKTICRLLPFYLRGRRLILFLEGIASPLNSFNTGEKAFHKWANETLIEASMSAQPMRLEWYLNHLFKEEWGLKEDIRISNYSPTQCIVYRKDECGERHTIDGRNKPITPNMTPAIIYSKQDVRLADNKPVFDGKSVKLVNNRIKSEVDGIGSNILIQIPKIQNTNLDTDECIMRLKKIVNKYMPVSGTYTIRTTN